jgi:hypothetical protein
VILLPCKSALSGENRFSPEGNNPVNLVNPTNPDHLCSPLFLRVNAYYNETYLSTFQKKEKKQARIPRKNG